jgi:hypothetical protein
MIVWNEKKNFSRRYPMGGAGEGPPDQLGCALKVPFHGVTMRLEKGGSPAMQGSRKKESGLG